MESEKIMCAGCENNDCEYFTIFNGCLLCSYCLEDFLEGDFQMDDFTCWLIRQRRKMKEDREKSTS